MKSSKEHGDRAELEHLGRATIWASIEKEN